MRHTLLAACLTFSPAAFAADNYYYHCSNGHDRRDIAVVYKKAPDATPCEVHYHKHGADRLLWQATTQKNYCEVKAKRFADEQASQGFHCQLRAGQVDR